MLCMRTNLLALLLSLLLHLPGKAADDTAIDERLAEKYGLHIPPAADRLEPAPEWIRDAEIVTSSAAVWKGHEFLLKDTPVTRIVRARSGYRKMLVANYHPVEKVSGIDAERVRGIPLLSHVPHSADAFRLAHEHGIKAVPYVHFMCIHTDYADQDVSYFEHPEILIKDAAGHWVHTGMDGTDRLHRFRTCANSPSYWRLSLDYVKKMMDLGADGVFIDNCGRRPPCFAPRFNHLRNPEFEPYVHKHLFPNASHDYAWGRFLQAVRALVKSYGEDKIVILNSGIGDPWQSAGDCAMWESFIFSWAWEGRRHTWSDVKAKAKANQWYLEAGRRIVALAFLDPRRHNIKDDAFWAFASARLVDFILWADLAQTEVEFLNRVHLGRGLGPCREAEQIAHRFFENGLVVLNHSREDRQLRLRVASELAGAELLDLYDGNKSLPLDEGVLEVRVPAQAARIFVVQERD
ncbi:MAG: hypothetical protein GXY25_17290 [Pirellulaceae bacterium]|nr:hypothetical protein [Pirellulaceae bacterium]